MMTVMVSLPDLLLSATLEFLPQEEIPKIAKSNKMSSAGLNLFGIFQNLHDLFFEFVGKLKIILQNFFNCISPLSEFCFTIGEPRTAFLDYVVFNSQVYNLEYP